MIQTRKKYLTEWDRRHAFRIANRKLLLATGFCLAGTGAIAACIASNAPLLAILAACGLTLASCAAGGWHLAKRQLARP